MRSVALRDSCGTGLQVTSDGTQHARAFVEGDRVRLLVAGFSTAGGDMFFDHHLGDERRPLQVGSIVGDQVYLNILQP